MVIISCKAIVLDNVSLEVMSFEREKRISLTVVLKKNDTQHSQLLPEHRKFLQRNHTFREEKLQDNFSSAITLLVGCVATHPTIHLEHKPALHLPLQQQAHTPGLTPPVLIRLQKQRNGYKYFNRS